MCNANDGPIVGIDLGTTNSVIAAVIDGQPQVLVENGEELLASVVGLNHEGQLVTGQVARNQLAAFPERTVASVKRKMGSMENITLGDQSFTPPEISAMILRRLVDRAGQALGVPVTRAVITVPAFFDENQRQATREAGELAGLHVERIINEPTASTLVYHAGSADLKHLVVYDFGGGTFDVSVVRMEGGVVEVLASQGDTHLGGDDIDELLLNYVADAFAKQHDLDLRANVSTRFRLRQACERAKCALSVDESVAIEEEFIAKKNGHSLNLSMTISRDELEEMISCLVDRTIHSVDSALSELNMSPHQIDDLVLVGGSTRIPLVAQRLRQEFQLEPSRAVDPDLAVALGAATQAAMHGGQPIGPVLVDVTTHTLGLEVCEDVSVYHERLVYSPMIPRNSPLPARYEQAYSTMYANQEMAEIHVLQGESEDIDRNQSIGKFNLDLERGEDMQKIVVRFDLTLDGTLRVTATQTKSGLSRELTINNALSQFRTERREKAQDRLNLLFKSSPQLVGSASRSPLPAPHAGPDSRQPAEDERPSDGSPADHFPAAATLLRPGDSLGGGTAAEELGHILRDNGAFAVGLGGFAILLLYFLAAWSRGGRGADTRGDKRARSRPPPRPGGARPGRRRGWRAS